MNQQRVISMTLRAALGAALLVAALSGCGKQAATEPVDTAVTVETAEAKAGDLSTDGIYIGTISADMTICRWVRRWWRRVRPVFVRSS